MKKFLVVFLVLVGAVVIVPAVPEVKAGAMVTAANDDDRRQSQCLDQCSSRFDHCLNRCSSRQQQKVIASMNQGAQIDPTMEEYNEYSDQCKETSDECMNNCTER